MPADIDINVGRPQRGDGRIEMRAVSRFDHHFEVNRLGRQLGENALMRVAAV